MGDDPSIFLVPTVKKGCSGAPSAAPQARCAAQGESSKISSLGHCDLDVWRVILTFFQKTNSAGQMLVVL
jgi:hypothetical protein